MAGWCDPQLLLGAMERIPTALQRAVAQALSEVTSALQNRYDLSTELFKTDVVPPYASTVIAGGLLTQVKLVLPGSGFIVVPTCTVVTDPDDAPGEGATVTAQITQGLVTVIHLLSCGWHYHQAPQVSIVGGGGAGALATCTIDQWGHVNSLLLTAGGSGYTTIPQVVFESVDGFGGGAAAVCAIKQGQVSGFTITGPGTGYTLPPSIVVDMSNQSPDLRVAKLVKIISIYSIRNAMGQAQNISDMMQKTFEMADVMCSDLKAGFDSLPIYEASKQIRSDVSVIRDNFKTLG